MDIAQAQAASEGLVRHWRAGRVLDELPALLRPPTRARRRRGAAWISAHCLLGRVGERLELEGYGSNVLGDARRALTWLVNEVSGNDIVLEVGPVVTTGACVVPMEISPGDEVLAD